MPRSKRDGVVITRIASAEDIDLAALSRLFASVDMRRRRASHMRAAIAGSSDVYAAYAGQTLVGFGRLISDLTYYGSIWDVAVSPDVQREGIGARILAKLLMCARRRRLVMVGLFTAMHNIEFYEGHGFQYHRRIHAMTRLLTSSDHS